MVRPCSLLHHIVNGSDTSQWLVRLVHFCNQSWGLLSTSYTSGFCLLPAWRSLFTAVASVEMGISCGKPACGHLCPRSRADIKELVVHGAITLGWLCMKDMSNQNAMNNDDSASLVAKHKSLFIYAADSIDDAAHVA